MLVEGRVRMTKGLAIAGSVSLTALIAAGVLATTLMAPADRFAACRTGVSATKLGGPFTLVNTQGRTVTDKDVITEPSLIYFGYTFCPDVCPLDMQRNVEAVDILAEYGLDVQPVFISIDPERDTPEALAAYAEIMHPDLVALTGSDEQVAAASKAYKTYYQKQPSEDEFYLVNHSTQSYLVFPEEGTVQFFTRDLRPAQLAETMTCFLET